jgi:2-(1,2-epoxy-1,2-dihydrophenyl)acetyl-CoA isomerase
MRRGCWTDHDDGTEDIEMPSHETIDLTADGPAARILLNRPEALNAWNEQFGLDLRDAVTTVARDDAIRAVMITGAGRGFSSGADLKEQRGDGARARDSATRDLSGLPDLSARLKDVYHPIITGLRKMPKPVIAAVNGPAVGIGCSLALAADLIVAAESAYFLLAFVNIGLVPDGGSTAFLPARVGYARSAEMAMLGERVPAEQALDWGLINRVVPDDRLEAEAGELLEKLADGPTRSYAGSKRLLNRRAYADLAGQLDAEAEAQREQGNSQDFIEGVMAFAEKRPARFTGA